MDTQKTRFIVCEFYVVYCGSYVQEYEQTKIEQRKDHNYGQLRSVTVSYWSKQCIWLPEQNN